MGPGWWERGDAPIPTKPRTPGEPGTRAGPGRQGLRVRPEWGNHVARGQEAKPGLGLATVLLSHLCFVTALGPSVLVYETGRINDDDVPASPEDTIEGETRLARKLCGRQSSRGYGQAEPGARPVPGSRPTPQLRQRGVQGGSVTAAGRFPLVKRALCVSSSQREEV